ADVTSFYAYLEATYPNEHRPSQYVLARPSLYGDYMGRPARAFLGALMLLAGLTLLGACANLGSLFAARAARAKLRCASRSAPAASASCASSSPKPPSSP